jgi:hypothetical protein
MISGGRGGGPADPGPANGTAEKAAEPKAAGPEVTTSDPGAQPSATRDTRGVDAAPIRPEVVDRMRWLLAAGEIGRDHAGLAESLIVSMLRRS